MSAENNASDRLIEAIRKKNDPTVMGLDTRYDYLPEPFAREHSSKGKAHAVLEFNLRLIDACADIVPAVKIQAAYYELMGIDGFAVMAQTAKAAHDAGYIVMIDAKRNDIGSTAAAYSAAYLASDAPTPCDFLTVNPYFGIDGIKPFADDCQKTGRGIFALVKTSNQSSGDFQDLVTDDGQPLYMRVADKVAEWGHPLVGEYGYSSVGAVVGATYPKQGAELRERFPHLFFLVPGYGAQGATADDIAGCFDRHGDGAIVNASRSIMTAYKKAGTDDFARAARDEAIRMRDDLNKAIHK